MQKPINLDWIIILILIVFGISLLIIEVIFIPGTTFVGIGGKIYLENMLLALIILELGVVIILGMSLITIISSFIYGLKAKPWEQFSLKETMTSTVNEAVGMKLKAGHVGLATSDLKPVGKGSF